MACDKHNTGPRIQTMIYKDIRLIYICTKTDHCFVNAEICRRTNNPGKIQDRTAINKHNTIQNIWFRIEDEPSLHNYIRNSKTTVTQLGQKRQQRYYLQSEKTKQIKQKISQKPSQEGKKTNKNINKKTSTQDRSFLSIYGTNESMLLTIC
jgi:hypothetical protein